MDASRGDRRGFLEEGGVVKGCRMMGISYLVINRRLPSNFRCHRLSVSASFPSLCACVSSFFLASIEFLSGRFFSVSRGAKRPPHFCSPNSESEREKD